MFHSYTLHNASQPHLEALGIKIHGLHIVSKKGGVTAHISNKSMAVVRELFTQHYLISRFSDLHWLDAHQICRFVTSSYNGSIKNIEFTVQSLVQSTNLNVAICDEIPAVLLDTSTKVMQNSEARLLMPMHKEARHLSDVKKKQLLELFCDWENKQTKGLGKNYFLRANKRPTVESVV